MPIAETPGRPTCRCHLRRSEAQAAWKRAVGRTLAGILALGAALYVGDWAVWRARMAVGSGMGTVIVDTMIETPLKGNKTEYDWAGTSPVDCSRSLFPQAGSGACWWLRRHPLLDEK